MNRKIKLISLITIVISFVGIKLSFGLFKENTSKVENIFIEAKEQNIIINETFDGVEKKDVYFDVETDTPTNIRVKIEFYFMDDEDNIESFTPIEGIDYDLVINDVWNYRDGYYYINYPLNLSRTPTLIKELKNLNDNYKLVVDVLVQTVGEIE